MARVKLILIQQYEYSYHQSMNIEILRSKKVLNISVTADLDSDVNRSKTQSKSPKLFRCIEVLMHSK